jgi:photosynthetic reaction center H subunit
MTHNREHIDRTADTTTVGRLVRLDDADYEVAEGYPDPSGWDVKVGGSNGQKIGEVDDLLVDVDAQRVRYLIVKLDEDVARAKDREILIPVGLARLDDEHDDVLVPNLTVETLIGLPPYEAGRFSREYENQIRTRLGGTAATMAAAEADYYSSDLFGEQELFRRRGMQGEQERRIPRVEEELAVGKRPVESGEVDVRKTVERERVTRQVPLSREEVEVERRPASGGPTEGGAFKEEEIRIPVMAEEAVVEKRPVVKEEFIIRKRVARETRPVDAEVRRERVDVEQRRGETGSRGEEPRAP